MKNIKIRLVLVILCTIIATSLLSVEAKSPAFTSRPNLETKFKYTATPGSKIIDYITISNLDNDRWVKLQIDTLIFPTRWLRIEPHSIIDLKPKESKNIKLTIVIPENAEKKLIKGTIATNLYSYEKTEQEKDNKGLTIGLGLGLNINIDIVEGKPTTQDFTTNIKFETITPEKPQSPAQTLTTKNIKTIISNIYILIENNINIVLLLIIISLLIKIAIQKHQTHEIQKNKIKVIKPKVIKKKKTPAKTTNKKPRVKTKKLKS